MTELLFLGFAVVLVASSLGMILHRNPVTSALFLVVAFCSLAGIYLMLHAEFLGMVQIIVYAGAIMVLFLFVIMYLNLGHDDESGVQIVVRRSLGWVIGGLVLAFGAILISSKWLVGPGAPEKTGETIGNTQAIGQMLYTRYIFPFEITSIVLLVAIIGAVVIAKGRTAIGRSESMADARSATAGPEGGALDVSTPTEAEIKKSDSSGSSEGGKS